MPTAYVWSPAGAQLPITDADQLWLARAVEAEGQPKELVAQALINRWATLYDQDPAAWPDLTTMVRAYAQPINPRWFEGGDLFEAQLPTLSPKEAAGSRRRAQMRPALAARTAFSADTIAAVEKAVNGPLTIPYGAVHFGPQADRPDVLIPGDSRRNAIYGDPKKAGRYGVIAPPAAHEPFTVWTPSRALDSGPPVAGLVVMAMALGAAYRLSRDMRRGGPKKRGR